MASVDIPINHPIQASMKHHAHIIRNIGTFVNRTSHNTDFFNTNADAKIDEDASPISCRR